MQEVLSQRLKTCRRNHKYTQKEVAIYCDITEKAYQNYELGTREPIISILMRIAKLYMVSLVYLVGLKYTPDP